MYSWTFNTRHLLSELQRNLKKCNTNWKQRMFAFKIKVFPLTITTFNSLCFWFVPYFSQFHTVCSQVGVYYANCQGLQQFTIEQPKQLQGGFRCSTVYLFATNFKIMIAQTRWPESLHFKAGDEVFCQRTSRGLIKPQHPAVRYSDCSAGLLHKAELPDCICWLMPHDDSASTSKRSALFKILHVNPFSVIHHWNGLMVYWDHCIFWEKNSCISKVRL